MLSLHSVRITKMATKEVDSQQMRCRLTFLVKDDIIGYDEGSDTERHKGRYLAKRNG